MHRPPPRRSPARRRCGGNPAGAEKTGLLRASAFKGADVYTIDVTGKTAWDDGVAYTEINTDWDKIGEVEDLVLDPAGNIVGAIAEVGEAAWASAKRSRPAARGNRFRRDPGPHCRGIGPEQGYAGDPRKGRRGVQ